MKQYLEKQYLFKDIKHKIYPWVKEALIDHQVLNGKYISEKDTPIISFVGNLMVILVIDRGDGKFEIVKDSMLSPETDIEALYHLSCENLARDVDFVISQTLFGGFGIVADGYHEASSLCFKHIWQLCADKLDDNVVIMVPAKDMVLFVAESNTTALKQMIRFGEDAYQRNRDTVSKSLFLFRKEEGELTTYDKED